MNGFLNALSQGYLHATLGQCIAFTLAVTHITIISVTIYLHRCQAHRALTLHPGVSHFFRFWLWMTSGIVTKEWAAVHRKHHARCETPEDPHSPQTRGLRTVILRGSELYRDEAKNTDTLVRFGQGTPDDWIEKNVYSPYSRTGVILMLFLDLVLFGVGGLTIWAIQMLWSPVFAAGIINGVGHYWGYRNYDCADAARNIAPWGILIGGEELHNNHHTFASSAKMSCRWYEFDIGWAYIRVLEVLRLAHVKKRAHRVVITQERTTIDAVTINAVIANRYDVMAHYAASLKRTLKNEIVRLRERNMIDSAAGRQWQRVVLRKKGTAIERRTVLDEVMLHSEALATMLTMRDELVAIWERSSASTDQIIQQLKDWCLRAEESGIQALQSMALRLRCYA